MSVRKFLYKTDDLKQELLDSDIKHIVYYTDDRTILLYADCRDVMPELKKLGIKPKTVIADPPYNVGQDFPNDKMEDKAFEIFTDNWISKVYDMMPVNSCFFMFYHQFGMWNMKNLLDKYDWEYLNLIIWAYPNFHNLRGSLPKIRSKKKKNRFPLSYQVIFFYGKDFCDDLQKQMYELNIKDRKDVWTDAAPQSTYKKPGYQRYHPCSKPESVISKIILSTTSEGDLVFDPFLGAGTTAVCAKRYGRFAIGCEIVKDYLDVTVQRLNQETLF